MNDSAKVFFSLQEQEEGWKLERQKSEVVHVVPEVQADGSHLEQLANLFDMFVACPKTSV